MNNICNVQEDTIEVKLPLRNWQTIAQALNDDILACRHQLGTLDKECQGDLIDFYASKECKCCELLDYLRQEVDDAL